MQIHIDTVSFKRKPLKSEIAGIKHRFTKQDSIRDMTVREIADALADGYTIQPGVTPFSEESRAKGNKGTSKDDFTQQTVFMLDHDNGRSDMPKDTPDSVQNKLSEYGLSLAFAYPTYNSTAENMRFRSAIVCDEAITNKDERDRIQSALTLLFPQTDQSCDNADRIFFGTDKGIYEGVGDMNAACKRSDLLALADSQCPFDFEAENTKSKFGEEIPVGSRHGTLVGFASTVLKKYGVSEKSNELFMQRVSQCAEPMPSDEVEKIWFDACKYYEKNICTASGYIEPSEYAFSDFMPKTGKKKDSIAYHTNLANTYMSEHRYLIGVQRLSKGGHGNDTVYEYVNGAWKARSESDVKSTLAKRVMQSGVIPDPTQVDKAYRLVIMSGERKDAETFNTDEDLVCFRNGVYRLSDSAVLEHSPDHYFTTQLNANIPDVIGETPYCDLCLANFGDADVQNLLLQIFGACISNVQISRFKKAVLQYGKGNTGKTQLKGLAERIVGQGNYNNVDLSDLETNRFLSAAFQNVRIGGSNDMSNVRVKELKIFKQLTGGDSIQAENKGEKSFTFRFKGMLWFLANQLPLFGGDKGEHVYDRWILIPCMKPIPPEKQIKDLAEKMYAERDSFCMKALRAFGKAVKDNYTFAVPESCVHANDEYRRRNSVVRTFIEECCEPFEPSNTGKAQTTGRFWSAFRSWCNDGNYYLPGKSEFRRELAVIANVNENELDRHTKDGNFYPYIIRPEAYRELCPYDITPLS